MTRRVMLWAFVVAALALAVWGVSTWVSPSTQCRGVEMTPGDVCTYSSTTDVSTTRTQTYEERVSAARQSAPVVIVLGLAAAGFGLHLVRQDGKRAEDAGSQPANDIGP